MMTTNHQLINQTSGKVKYYTPPAIIKAARATMGGIDLDPASSAKANDIVRALWYYTIRDNGLSQPWFGRVWMNHPFTREGNKLWPARLVDAYTSGEIEQACCITFASTSEKWFRPLLDYPQCYLYGRTNYLLPDGTVKKGVTKGSVVTYLGPYTLDFKSEFEGQGLGKVKI